MIGKCLKSMTKLVLSPRIITGIGIVVALVQLGAAVEQFISSPSRKKRIGFEE